MNNKNKLNYGVAVNDADYHVQSGKGANKVTCPFYATWRSMLRRVYDEKYKEKHPTYVGVKICESWLVFSGFRSWMADQPWKGRVLDKDILGNGAKIYSPETCAFVLPKTNAFLTNCGKSSELNFHFLEKRNVYRVKCGNGNGKEIFIGDFQDIEVARKAWVKCKADVAKYLASLEKDSRIIERLNNIEEILNA